MTTDIRVGDVVIVPKGAPVASTHPNRKLAVANRERRVRVAALIDDKIIWPAGGGYRNLCSIQHVTKWQPGRIA